MPLKLSQVAPLGLMVWMTVSTVKASLATDYQIYVAARETPASAIAEGKANGTSVFAERGLQKALNQAGTLLSAPGAHSVSIRMAGGDYTGQAGAGTCIVPQITNPQATLHIIGGFADDFGSRQPFTHLTKLVTNEGRNQGILQLSKQSKLKEFVVSGLVFDAAPSNKYDAESNSILKGSSRTVPLINFGILQTDHLVVADNVFLNGAHGAFDPYIAPMSANTVVDITNNFFLNTIKTLQIGAGIGFRNNTVREVNLRGNTFLLNWPYNPDRTSSNVGAVDLYHRDGAQQLNIEGNLFAYNVGGAMQHSWPENRMPKIVLRNNLFFKNASLFGDERPGAGVFIGKFGTNAKYLILDAGTIADDFGYTVDGNVVLDPGVATKPLLAVTPIEGGDDIALKGYAPAMKFDPQTLPLPTNEAAKAFGVQTNKIWSP